MVFEIAGIKPTWEKHHHAAPTTDADTRALRVKEGQCPTCGAQTHEIKKKGLVKKSITRVPLTQPGETQRGRCLLCHPVPDASGSSPGQSRSSFLGLGSMLSGRDGPAAPATPPRTPSPSRSKPRRSDDEKQASSSSLISPPNSKSKRRSSSTADVTKSSQRSAAGFAYYRSASERTIGSILDMGSCIDCSSVGWTSREKAPGWRRGNNQGYHRRSLRWPRVGGIG